MSLEDARYKVIRCFPSEVANAYGQNIHDPRSGEILQSYVCVDHNVMTLLHDWYMVQASPNDPRARTMKFSDELMGTLIFFFQAEDGIRDVAVTGVQTCALPISRTPGLTNRPTGLPCAPHIRRNRACPP